MMIAHTLPHTILTFLVRTNLGKPFKQGVFYFHEATHNPKVIEVILAPKTK